MEANYSNAMLPMWTDEQIVEESGNLEYLYVLPVIMGVGLLGNIVSLITIFNSRLRYIGANQYLIVLTLADSVFLVGIGLILLKVDYTSYINCVAVEYVLMSSSYVSAWATAALTMERYIAIVHPLLSLRLASTSRIKMMAVWVPIPFVLHLLQFINLVPADDPLQRACTLREGTYQFFAEIIDALLCYGFPCAIVVVLNGVIAYRMASTKRAFSGESRAINRAGELRDSKRSGTSGHLAILWVVPMTFVALNTPFYIIKIIDIVESMNTAGDIEYTSTRMIIHNIAHYLYYLNFSCDVIVYAFSSANFRKTVVHSWKKLLRFEQKKRPIYTAVELNKMSGRLNSRMTHSDAMVEETVLESYVNS